MNVDQCRMMINGIQFIQVLLEANGLAAGKDHQFKGRYDAEKNAVTASVFSGVNGFWLRSILNPPQRKLIEQKTK